MKARPEQLEAALSQLRKMDQQRQGKGTDPQKNPAQLPVTDPDSRILPNKEGGYAPNYTPMAVAETENGFIVGADVLIGNVEHGEKPQAVLGDSAYSTGQNLTAMEEREQELLSPLVCEEVADNPARRADVTQAVAAEDLDRLPINAQSKRFDKQAFIYDEESDCYYCPAGQALPREETEKAERSGETITLVIYRCRDCMGAEAYVPLRTSLAMERLTKGCGPQLFTEDPRSTERDVDPLVDRFACHGAPVGDRRTAG